MEQDRYEKIAMKIIPTGDQPARTWQREAIAKFIAAEVADALAKQRAEQFPEMGELESLLKVKENRLQTRDREVQGREKSAADRETRLSDFLKAMEAYEAWLAGDGPADENGKRFEALRAAARKVKDGKK